MHKKLKKYIESYLVIDSSELENNSIELIPNGGMTLLINLGLDFEIINNEKKYPIKQGQTVLLNAYENSIFLNHYKESNLILIRFKGAGASFFFQEVLDILENDIIVFNEPLIKETKDIIPLLDDYFINKFKPSTLPFNIMKIINLIEESQGDYNIDDVLALANTPRRIFDKIFRREVGLSLKTYAHIIKKKTS